MCSAGRDACSAYALLFAQADPTAALAPGAAANLRGPFVQRTVWSHMTPVDGVLGGGGAGLWIFAPVCLPVPLC